MYSFSIISVKIVQDINDFPRLLPHAAIQRQRWWRGYMKQIHQPGFIKSIFFCFMYWIDWSLLIVVSQSLPKAIKWIPQSQLCRVCM